MEMYGFVCSCRTQQAGGRGASEDTPIQALPLQNVRLRINTQEAVAQAANEEYLLKILEPDRLLHRYGAYTTQRTHTHMKRVKKDVISKVQWGRKQNGS